CACTLLPCSRASRRTTGWHSTRSPAAPYAKLSTLVARSRRRKRRLSARASRAPTMRTVSGPVGEALRAQVRNAVGPGTPRRTTAYCTATLFFLRSVRVVRVDDACHQGVAHDVLCGELGEGDAAHAGQDAARLDE